MPECSIEIWMFIQYFLYYLRATFLGPMLLHAPPYFIFPFYKQEYSRYCEKTLDAFISALLKGHVYVNEADELWRGLLTICEAWELKSHGIGLNAFFFSPNHNSSKRLPTAGAIKRKPLKWLSPRKSGVLFALINGYIAKERWADMSDKLEYDPADKLSTGDVPYVLASRTTASVICVQHMQNTFLCPPSQWPKCIRQTWPKKDQISALFW